MNIQNYESFLSTSATQDSAIIRGLLGDRCSPISAAVTPTQIAKYSYQVSALLAVYRLLDFELLYNRPGQPITLPPLYPNCITPEMVGKQKVKDRWRKLGNWQMLLIEFRDCYDGITFGEDIVRISEPPFSGSLAHLQGLADLHPKQKFISVVQNFRGAALHWTVLHETAHRNTHELAIMPENLAGIIDGKSFQQVNQYYQSHTQERIHTYLRQHGRGELALPLHLSLLLTPCFLLMSTSLVKSKFPRQTIYQVSIQRRLIHCNH